MLTFYLFCFPVSCWKIQAIVDTLNNDRADKIYLEEVDDDYSGDIREITALDASCKSKPI